MTGFFDKQYVWRTISWLLSFPFVHQSIRAKLYSAFGLEISSDAVIASGVFVGSRKLVMQAHSFVNVNCFIDGSEQVCIGEYVQLGPYVKILTGSHAPNNSVLRLGPGAKNTAKPVLVERGCWVGVGAIILPGVVVREGCVIAAGAVVHESTQPNGLYAGVPAKRIKDLPLN